MKLVLDRAFCDGNALCVKEAPELLAMDENEEPVVRREELGPDDLDPAKRAAAVCPKAALSIRA